MANIEGVVVSTLSQSETVVADPFAVYTKVDSV
jgi:hypothetical protein